jgi:predicted small lipoprotein YifL
MLAAAANWNGRLPSLTALDSEDSVEIAAALARRKGPLWLPKLTKISPQALRALFGEPDVVNPVDRPPELPANAARARVLRVNGLGPLPGQDRVSFGGLTRLDVETARTLAAAEKWDGLLSLAAFDSVDSVEIAQVLATRKGPLLLPNLKQISPRTLSALIVKQDVEIPLVETLEFIAEPDGGPTEDFVIPDWLQQRQKQQRAMGLPIGPRQ